MPRFTQLWSHNLAAAEAAGGGGGDDEVDRGGGADASDDGRRTEMAGKFRKCRRLTHSVGRSVGDLSE